MKAVTSVSYLLSLSDNHFRYLNRFLLKRGFKTKRVMIDSQNNLNSIYFLNGGH